jgi:hypothetical protein
VQVEEAALFNCSCPYTPEKDKKDMLLEKR